MDVEIGDSLQQDVFNSYGLLVLSGGSRLDEDSVSKLFQHSIDYVDIVPRAFPVESAIPPESRFQVIREAAKTLQSSVNLTSSLFALTAQEGKLSEDLVEAGFQPLSEQFARQVDVASLLLLLDDKDEYTYRHSVQVGMLSYYLAKWLGKSEEECLLAGKAGYLHDIGKSKISPAILNKPDKLTAEEFEIVKQVPIFSHDLIMEATGDPNLALPALQLHERYTGKGYPYGIGEREMHPFAKIVAITDIYSAMISVRSYKPQRDLLNVLHELHRMSFSEIDPYYTQVFIRHMLPNLIGKNVLLSNGAPGKIIMTNPTDAFRPLVQVEEQFIDLSLSESLRIDKFMAEVV